MLVKRSSRVKILKFFNSYQISKKKGAETKSEKTKKKAKKEKTTEEGEVEYDNLQYNKVSIQKSSFFIELCNFYLYEYSL